ncbi:maleylpyruvate isomerase family mycothiol-dependent enzyme [Rhodococcus sp. ARC_M6]|uniref:maleylpyruvate isomerase family mycothiol-dependent enzyme n=1 Tax=Rhodococcus sp. ARC_M6 TaxID=2928852 RepID=UPI001FB338F5|nr:maleylpyruvate isomerase family mycothiol-dependent enzyme [Rhodococcus sp. ARC_M6]MCJ0903521.1 maleylpyruvate isomerase family mycothiol-dependent enzyme [Rhodococcus sp. ARC_M6]
MTKTYADLVAAVRESDAKAQVLIGELTDSRAREPSALPGWSRGHVVTHLSRNADALNRFVIGVNSGEPAEMYPGGPPARTAAIEEGADRPASLLAADYRFSGSRLVQALAEVPADRLDTPVNWRKPVTAHDLPILRWNEIEIHLTDLDVGYTCHDWPPEYVEFTLARQLGALEAAAPNVAVPSLSDAETLAWLIGRPPRPGLPKLPAWPY